MPILRRICDGEPDRAIRRQEQVFKNMSMNYKKNDNPSDGGGGSMHTPSSAEGSDPAERLDMSAFPAANPFPVLCISREGIVLFSNEAGHQILNFWTAGVGRKIPEQWQRIVETVIRSQTDRTQDIEVEDKTFALTVTHVPGREYANVYGLDVGKRRRVETALLQSRTELKDEVVERTRALAKIIKYFEREVDQRKKAEALLAERSKTLDAFFEHSITPLVILDSRFTFVRVNRAYAEACGRNVADFPGENHFELYPDEENQRIFEEVVSSRKPYQAIAKPFSNPDHPEWGVTYWDWMLVPILDDSGEVESLVLSMNDVTAKKRSEIAMLESRTRYRSLVELSPDAIVVTTGDWIAFVNAAGVELAGVREADEIIGRKIWEFIHPDSRKDTMAILRQVVKDRGKAGPVVLRIVRPDGQTTEVEASAVLTAYEDAEGVQTVLRDISERKKSRARTQLTNNLLKLFALKNSRDKYLKDAIRAIHTWSGLDSVGIRLKDVDGRIPYEACTGTSGDFLSHENSLSLKETDCLCMHVIGQTPDPYYPVKLTTRGSFISDDICSLSDDLYRRHKYRCAMNCVGQGFKSLAIIPVRCRERMLGALHLADKTAGRISSDVIEFLEDMALLIGEALHRFDVEDSLRQSRERLLGAQRIAHVGNWELDLKRNILWWSDEVYRIFGSEPGVFGATYEAFLASVHPDDRSMLEAAVTDALEADKPYAIDHRIVRPDGSVRFVHEQGEVFRDSEGQAVKMVGTVQDITKIKQIEEKIRADRKALRSLAAELQMAEERERRRIAGDLHDSIGQILAFSRRELAGIEKSTSTELARSLREVGGELDKAVRQVRTLSFELSPSVLYDLGLSVAIEDLAERFSKERGIGCKFEDNALSASLSEADRLLVYRSVRELLINVAKHADASDVVIKTEDDGGNFRITVADNGKGIDPATLDDKLKRYEAFGIFKIRERLLHAGGDFDLQSQPGNGTIATITLPLEGQQTR